MNNSRRGKAILASAVIVLAVLNIVPFRHEHTTFCPDRLHPVTKTTIALGFPAPYSMRTSSQYSCTAVQSGQAPELLRDAQDSHSFWVQAVFTNLLVAGVVYMLLQLTLEFRRGKK